MTLLPGIADLERRLSRVVDGCRLRDSAEEDPGATVVEKDKFVALKKQLVAAMRLLQDLVRERRKVAREEKKGSSSSEFVKLSIRTRTLMDQCRTKSGNLRQILREQCARANSVGLRLGSKLSQRELDWRYDQLSAIEEFVEACSRCVKSPAEPVPEIPPELLECTTDMRTARKKLFGDDSETPLTRGGDHGGSVQQPRPSHRVGELSAEEEGAMEEWTARMDDIDKDIDDIDVMVDRLREVAVEMGEAGQRHSELIERIKDRNEDVNGGIRAVSDRVRGIVLTENKSAMTCRVVLGIVLLIMAGWIYTRVKD